MSDEARAVAERLTEQGRADLLSDNACGRLGAGYCFCAAESRAELMGLYLHAPGVAGLLPLSPLGIAVRDILTKDTSHGS